MTWDELVKLEPRLEDVEQLAIYLGPGLRRWSDYEAIKRRAAVLVGWHAEKDDLATPECYDIAMRHLLACWEIGNREP